MDTQLILDTLAKAVGSLAGTLLITFTSIIFTKLKNKIGEDKLKNFISNAVKAAEQLYPNNGMKQGTVKYEYVMEQIHLKYPKLKDNTYLNTLIEAAVYEVSEQVKLIAKANEKSSGDNLSSF